MARAYPPAHLPDSEGRYALPRHLPGSPTRHRRAGRTGLHLRPFLPWSGRDAPHPEGKKDPLLSVYDGHRGIHFNNDVAVVLPEDAVLLARDPTGQIEAVRFAERAWGVQFHPECTPEIFDAWTIGHGEKEWQQRLPWSEAVTVAETVRRDIDTVNAEEAFAARFQELIDPEKR